MKNMKAWSNREWAISTRAQKSKFHKRKRSFKQKELVNVFFFFPVLACARTIEKKPMKQLKNEKKKNESGVTLDQLEAQKSNFHIAKSTFVQ